MATLAETQQQLFNFLQSKDSTIESLVTGKTDFAIKRRLAIYREAYQLRLSNHLAKQFPVLRALLQTQAFETLALAYLSAYPPTHFAIRSFGDRLADFLVCHPPYADLGYYSELARLEWRLNHIVDETASAPLLTVGHLSTLNPDDLPNTCFQLQSYVHVETFNYDTPRWRDALKKSPKTAKAPAALAHPVSYALWRKDFQPFYRPLSALEVQLLTGLKLNLNFTELCAIALKHDASAADDAAAAQHVVGCLLTWINDGYFIATLTTRN